MRLARFVLFASALPFLALGLAFLLAPQEIAAHVGIALVNATADNDARAVYGGMQLACGALLLAAARAAEPLVRAGLAAQLALYGGLASARFVSLAIVGAPRALGFALHAGELLALATGALAWRALAREASPRVGATGDTSAAPGGIAIERAGPDDLAELLPLVDSFQREEGYASGDAALRDAVAALLADSRAGALLIAREGERAIGYAALCLGFSIEFRGRDAFVDELYVAPEKRGAGLGRALLRALEAEARTLGVAKLHLEVEQRNDAARELYVQEGFAATGRELLSKAPAPPRE
ncbi:MAG TPA: GNAT family N-acetyltransferase [Myxococcota bacterium]|jgi:ribosomal protein S18 acetylase RimI-like enzyme